MSAAPRGGCRDQGACCGMPAWPAAELPCASCWRRREAPDSPRNARVSSSSRHGEMCMVHPCPSSGTRLQHRNTALRARTSEGLAFRCRSRTSQGGLMQGTFIQRQTSELSKAARCRDFDTITCTAFCCLVPPRRHSTRSDAKYEHHYREPAPCVLNSICSSASSCTLPKHLPVSSW